MTQQTALDLDTPPADPHDRVGFDIGWDHARHALVPPAGLMLAGTPIGEGWRAARAVFGHRTVAAGRSLRQWLDLRLRAWREAVVLDLRQVTPQFLAQLETRHCPVTRAAFGGHPDGDTAPVITRLRDDDAYVAGNLLLLSRAAARAKAGRDAAQVLQQAERLARLGDDACDQGLDAAAWLRLACLMSLAVELPAAQVARLPLRALPPGRVQLRNPAQGLQTLLTLRLQAAGWSRRARAVADLLPRAELRHDFNLFVGALAVPLMRIAADATPLQQRWALEDAWAEGRVQRRWAQFAVQLSVDEAQALLQRLTRHPLAGLAGLRLQAPDTPAAADVRPATAVTRRPEPSTAATAANPSLAAPATVSAIVAVPGAAASRPAGAARAARRAAPVQARTAGSPPPTSCAMTSASAS